MKKVLISIFLIAVVLLVFYHRDSITEYITEENVLPNSTPTNETKPVEISYNGYKYGDWQFVQNTSNFTANSYSDFNNIFYSILNSGVNEYTFECSTSYTTCINDVQQYVSTDETLGNINNLVHPYNSFKNIKVSVSSRGKVTIAINHIYSEEQINYVNNQITSFIQNNISANMSDSDKIKTFHDYIINNTKYDQNVKTVQDKINLSSYNAYGLFTNHKAICGGYTDALAIYLHMLGFTNYRVATTEHIWNLVYVNGSFLHLDATWDDPVTSNGSDQLLHDYFLINTSTLHQQDAAEHNFNTNIYREAN